METDPTSPVYDCPSCGSEKTNPDMVRPNDPNLIPYPIYQIGLLCKDDSTAAIDKVYKLYYYSHESKDYFFGGIKPSNLYLDDTSRGMLEHYLTLITRFNVYLELGIRRKVSSGG